MVSGPIQLMGDRSREVLSLHLPRTIPFRSPVGGRNRVRRSLFGPRDPGESYEFMNNEMKKLQEAECKRWNFDFKTGIPLEPAENQRWKWFKVLNLAKGASNSACNNNSKKSGEHPSNSSVCQSVSAVKELQSLAKIYVTQPNNVYQAAISGFYIPKRKLNPSGTSNPDETSTTPGDDDLSFGGESEELSLGESTANVPNPDSV